MMISKPKIFVAGHKGMVGSALVRALQSSEVEIITRTRAQLDLLDQAAVRNFFEDEKPDQVYLAAAKVGGILANNTYPAEFIYENLMIASNVISAAFHNGVKKLLYLGSSCIYPRLAPQPMPETSLLTGALELTNEPYAVAKIAGIKLCESFNRQYGDTHGVDYRSVMPTNLYGFGDNYHEENSHVIPGLFRRFHEAIKNQDTKVTIWGSGTPMREFLFVDDLAKACVFVMGLDKEKYSSQVSPMHGHINIGSGCEITIRDLAKSIADVVGFKGRIEFDVGRPDGSPRKLLDSTKIMSLGWSPVTDLKTGLALTYRDYINSVNYMRGGV